MFVSINVTIETIFKAMEKNINRSKKQFNPVVLDKLQAKYGVTKHYIRMSLNGDRVSITSDRIKADYKLFCAEIDKALTDL